MAKETRNSGAIAMLPQGTSLQLPNIGWPHRNFVPISLLANNYLGQVAILYGVQSTCSTENDHHSVVCGCLFAWSRPKFYCSNSALLRQLAIRSVVQHQAVIALYSVK